jgi:hypothetical protein
MTSRIPVFGASGTGYSFLGEVTSGRSVTSSVFDVTTRTSSLDAEGWDAARRDS